MLLVNVHNQFIELFLSRKQTFLWRGYIHLTVEHLLNVLKANITLHNASSVKYC